MSENKYAKERTVENFRKLYRKINGKIGKKIRGPILKFPYPGGKKIWEGRKL